MDTDRPKAKNEKKNNWLTFGHICNAVNETSSKSNNKWTHYKCYAKMVNIQSNCHYQNQTRHAPYQMHKHIDWSIFHCC